MTHALTDLPLHRAISRLAWPAMASMMMVNVFNLIDAFWVGRLGTDALGGMTASAFLFWCLHAGGQLVGIGVNAVVARRVGEKRSRAAGVAATHGLLLAVLVAAALVAVTLPSQRAIFSALGLTPSVAAAARSYLTPILYGFPAITCWYAVEAVYRGSGDTRTPMWILGCTLLLNAVIDPLFIFGLGPFPGLGIAGAAWATILTHVLGVAAALTLLRGRPERLRVAAPDRLVELKLLGTIVRVGAPIAISSFLFSVTYIFLTWIIARCGSAPLAAIGVGHRVEGLPYFTCVGFAAAAATLVGQYLGAKKPARAEKAAWLATGLAVAVVALLAVVFFAFAPWILALFSRDASVIAHGVRYLRIVALLEVGMAFELVLEGAFAGAGNSVPPMLVSVPLTVLRIPLAYWLALEYGLGAPGIWWAISITTGAKGALIAVWFRSGRWKRATV